MCSSKGGNLDLAVLFLCLGHDLLQSASDCIVDPFFAALGANGRTHPPDDDYTTS